MTGLESVVIVGASAGGLSAVEALRRNGYTGRITVVGDELHSPYDRPPLSKQVLQGTWEPERAALRSAQSLSALHADFLLGDRAVGLDVEARTVHTAAGRRLEGDAIVIATGVRARRLAGQGELAGVHVLRSLDDTLALRADLLTASCVAVVGEGVLGSEIAATARQLGLTVTLAGPLAAPMFAQIGALASGVLAQVHEEQGVQLRLGTGVAGLVSHEGHATGVRLHGGEEIPADVVVVAIGSVPATDWLEGSGLKLDNGVLCDAQCRAAPGIFAVGDVARWHHPGLGRPVRFENRTNATEQAEAVVAAMLGGTQPYMPIPYFWSDQFDAKLQVFGVIAPDAEVEIVDGDLPSRRFVARYTEGGRTTGILGWNMAKQVRMRRRELVVAAADAQAALAEKLQA